MTIPAPLKVTSYPLFVISSMLNTDWLRELWKTCAGTTLAVDAKAMSVLPVDRAMTPSGN